jgi:hypothetical protein
MLTKKEIEVLLKVCEKLTMPVEQSRYIIKIEDKLQVMLETAPEKDAEPEPPILPKSEPAEEVPLS